MSKSPIFGIVYKYIWILKTSIFCAGLPGVSGLVPNRILSLHTTHSWDFLHLGSSFSSFMTPGTRVGEDTIVGVIDTGKFWIG